MVLLPPAALRAASFGVPGAGGDPPGYFVLTAHDAVNATVNIALGDVSKFQVVYIEVPTNGLRVDLYDPGLFNPALGAGQLDLNLASPAAPAASIRYDLFGPDGAGTLDALLAQRTFGPDDATTNRQLVTLFNDNRAVPGLYHLVARMIDGGADEQDVAVFGVRIPGRAAYTLNFTGGHVNEGGATILEPLQLFPLVVSPTAGSDSIGPVCGLQFITFDMESPPPGSPTSEPPRNAQVTAQGFRFDTRGSSPDARWWEVDLGGINPGDLDSSDHGMWTWEFWDFGAPGAELEDCFSNLSPARDFNLFGAQVLNYAAPARSFASWADVPDRPPFPVFNADRPRRLYLPDDSGRAPLREVLNQRASIVAGFPVISVGLTSTVEVVLTLENPQAYPLANVVGMTHVAPDAILTDPAGLTSGGGLTATINAGDPRRIDFTGSVAPGATGIVRYRVDVTPTALGRFFLTGNGADFTGGARATSVTYATPYTDPLRAELPVESQGPICQLEYEAVLPSCAVDAQLSATTLRTCPGTPVTLDATGSTVYNCPGGVPIHQWRVNGAIIFGFPAADTIDVTPFLNDTWEVEVACSTEPATCSDTASVTFDLYPAPVVDLGGDRVMCSGDTIRLTATTSDGTPPYSNARWSTTPPGAPGDGATTAVINVSPATDTTYTFAIDDAQGCTGTQSIAVDVRAPDPALAPATPGLCPGGTVTIAAAPGFVSYAWSTTPAGARDDGATTESVTADQVGVTYSVTVTDDAGCTGVQAVTVVDAPPLQPTIAPANPALCPGGSVQLVAQAGFATYLWDSAGADPGVDGSSSDTVTASVIGATYSVTVTDGAGCSGMTSVMTTASPDPVPGVMNWSLRVTKASASDLRHAWIDLPDPAGAYQVVTFDCTDAGGDGQCDVPPTQANMAASPTTVNVPVGAQASVEPGGVTRAPRLVFSKVRALSPCSLTPGAFGN